MFRIGCSRSRCVVRGPAFHVVLFNQIDDPHEIVPPGARAVACSSKNASSCEWRVAPVKVAMHRQLDLYSRNVPAVEFICDSWWAHCGSLSYAFLQSSAHAGCVHAPALHVPPTSSTAPLPFLLVMQPSALAGCEHAPASAAMRGWGVLLCPFSALHSTFQLNVPFCSSPFLIPMRKRNRE